MEANESNGDRIIRVAIGVAALIGVIALGLGSVAGILLGIVAVIMFATAAVGFCPLYRVFGISTCKVARR